jgi:Kef-type K+ transport system membrane component KefB
LLLCPLVVPFTGFTTTVWPTAAVLANGSTYNSVTTFYVVANVGVILFMFLLGCELDQRLLSKQWKKSAPIALSAIMFPFGVGCAAALWLEVGMPLPFGPCWVPAEGSYADIVDTISFVLSVHV